VNKFDEKAANLSLKFGVLIAGEIERQLLSQMLCVVKSTPGRQVKNKLTFICFWRLHCYPPGLYSGHGSAFYVNPVVIEEKE